MVERVHVRELPLRGCLDLRLDPRNEAALSAISNVLGAALPGANAWVAGSGTQILWQAFDEWLIFTADGRQMALEKTLRGALGGVHYALTDVSDVRTAFELTGLHARDVLQKGSAADFHPRVFGSTTCITTALARVRVTLRQAGDAAAYEILVERSFGGYLRDWLEDAALEYG